MGTSFIARSWNQRDRAGWRNFGIAMLALAVAFFVALFSAATAQEGRVWLAAITTLISLGNRGMGGRRDRSGSGATHQPALDCLSN